MLKYPLAIGAVKAAAAQVSVTTAVISTVDVTVTGTVTVLAVTVVAGGDWVRRQEHALLILGLGSVIYRDVQVAALLTF